MDERNLCFKEAFEIVCTCNTFFRYSFVQHTLFGAVELSAPVEKLKVERSNVKLFKICLYT